MCHKTCNKKNGMGEKIEVALLYQQLQSLHRIEEHLECLKEWLEEACDEDEEYEDDEEGEEEDEDEDEDNKCNCSCSR